MSTLTPGLSLIKPAGGDTVDIAQINNNMDTIDTKMPRGSMGYAQVIANQATITTETDLTGLSVTVTTVGTRRLKISAQIEASRTAVDGTNALRIKEDATVLQIAYVQPNIAANACVHEGSVIVTPPAGAHTYKLSLEVNSGTGSTSLLAGATYPAFILVEDIGAA